MSSEETQEVAIVKVPYLAPLAPFTTGISIEERFNSFHRANQCSVEFGRPGQDWHA